MHKKDTGEVLRQCLAKLSPDHREIIDLVYYHEKSVEEVAEIGTAPIQPSTKDEWAQEARKLELQGKQEQARSIRETFLASRPTPWTPWSLTALGEWAPKALDPRNPSAKIKQNMFDYALWHGQGAYIEKLAREAKFAAALPLEDGVGTVAN